MASVFDSKWYELLTNQIARYLFAIPFIVSGVFHFMNGPAMANQVLAKWPANTLLVYLAGAGLIAAGISILIRRQDRLATLLLGVLLLIFVFTIHLPTLFSAQEQAVQQAAMAGLLKDLALAGGAFMASGLASKI